MKINGIDRNKCTACTECIKECPAKLFGKQNKEITFANPYEICIECGHCIAVCPVDAILFESSEPLPPVNKAAEKLLSSESVFQFLGFTRSIRRFKSEPVAPEDLEGVLKAMQYAPSASNARSWQYVVIREEAKRDYFAVEVLSMFKQMLNLIRLRRIITPFVPPVLKKFLTNPATKENIERMLSDREQGIDHIFFNAPCIIVIHSPVYADMAGNDAGIALTYGMLAARARGLGSCWIGFAKAAVSRIRRLQKWLALPRGHKVQGVMVLGYPAVKFKRIPPREKLNVRYM